MPCYRARSRALATSSGLCPAATCAGHQPLFPCPALLGVTAAPCWAFTHAVPSALPQRSTGLAHFRLASAPASPLLRGLSPTIRLKQLLIQGLFLACHTSLFLTALSDPQGQDCVCHQPLERCPAHRRFSHLSTEGTALCPDWPGGGRNASSCPPRSQGGQGPSPFLFPTCPLAPNSTVTLLSPLLLDSPVPPPPWAPCPCLTAPWGSHPQEVHSLCPHPIPSKPLASAPWWLLLLGPAKPVPYGPVYWILFLLCI